MKKLITIMLIAVVLVGAVFADPDSTQGVDSAAQTHELTIQAAVYGTLPSFGLKVSKVNGSSFTATAVTNSNKAEYVDTDTKYEATETLSAITDTGTITNGAVNAGTFTLDRAGSITVAAVVQNNAKVLKAYQLEFFGGQFTGILRDGKTQDADKGVYNPTSISAVGGSGTGFTTALGTTSSQSNIDMTSDAWEPADAMVSVTVTFKLTETTAGTPLAECTFNYAGDDDINPGNYEAVIGMVVTSI